MEGAWRVNPNGCRILSLLLNRDLVRSTPPQTVDYWRATLARELEPYREHIRLHWTRAGSWAYLIVLNSRFTSRALPWRPICQPAGAHRVEDELSQAALGRTMRTGEVYKLAGLNARGLLTLESHLASLERVGQGPGGPQGAVVLSSRRPSLQLLCPTRNAQLSRSAYVAELLARICADHLHVYADAYYPGDRPRAERGLTLPWTNFPAGWLRSPDGGTMVSVPSHEAAPLDDPLDRRTIDEHDKTYSLASLGVDRYRAIEAVCPVIIMVVGCCPWTDAAGPEHDLIRRVAVLLQAMGLNPMYG